MMAHYAWGCLGAGAALVARPYSLGSRTAGLVLLGVGSSVSQRPLLPTSPCSPRTMDKSNALHRQRI